jgi:hypothetical protein
MFRYSKSAFPCKNAVTRTERRYFQGTKMFASNLTSQFAFILDELFQGVFANVVAGIILLLLSLALGVLVRKYHPIEMHSWRGKEWVEKTTQSIVLIGSAAEETIEIRNMPEGQLLIEITNDFGSEILGSLICVDHGKPVGIAKVSFLPKNEIRVKASGKNGYGFDLFFVCRSNTQSPRGGRVPNREFAIT